MYWLTSTGPGRKEIWVTLDSGKKRILFADSGPGISSTIRPHLFKPFYSEKSPPSGLGLYICRHYLAQERAAIRLARANERCELVGAQFIVDCSKTAENAAWMRVWLVDDDLPYDKLIPVPDKVEKSGLEYLIRTEATWSEDLPVRDLCNKLTQDADVELTVLSAPAVLDEVSRLLYASAERRHI